MLKQLKDFFNWRIFIVIFSFVLINKLLIEVIGWYFNLSSFHFTFDLSIIFLYLQFLIMTVIGVWLVHTLNRFLPWDSSTILRIIFEMISFIVIYTIINFIIAQISAYIIVKQFLNLSRDLIYMTVISTFHMLVFIPFLEFFISFKSNYENKLKIQALQLELTQNQYELLKAKINPHFIFNSLSVLNSLITIDSNKAKTFTNSFSDVLRFTLDYENVENIKVEKEYKFLEQYIYLLKTRYGDALQVNLDIKKESFNYRIPPMTLQLLIENVVKHNIISNKKTMQIDVLSKQDGIIVSNPIQLKTAEASWGIGLESIKSQYERLEKEFKIEQDKSNFRVFVSYI
ncbi:MAG: hypothetical protein BM557_07285 [Flavobacterium sp. MedPE-SWcel]|uniref:sensor histidine kinase n=1 Tax=uncultured Flavobacterium sp. TaxID=165435 RepID=UPI000917CFE5|nr:histidine kinase [uncultured Flavobacterium sp.]OIQ18715.1 MAG: hypothetical protein BM557_07285 [Flavobacterium sp. MedPE-SWcel]